MKTHKLGQWSQVIPYEPPVTRIRASTQQQQQQQQLQQQQQVNEPLPRTLRPRDVEDQPSPRYRYRKGGGPSRSIHTYFENGLYCCMHCPKKFEHNKGIGGHMKIHKLVMLATITR
ncbi:uncharacterized protein [Rutidosis leptorrhynchoides]|uniref:uncharacterized protein isoform X1 n=1 Tax=Rutidosis leptorrhynchoides TaxID=125765 RepID=UPI003A9906C8